MNDGWGLSGLHASAETVLADTLADAGGSIGRVVALETDLEPWLQALSSRPESNELASARRDLGYALYAASTGLYRMAFSSLRSFLEVAVFAIRMSASEYERRRWVNGRRDLNWSEVISVEDGMYSTNFLREFAPTVSSAEATEFRNKMTDAYRVTSEYLHGNVERTTMLPTRLAYDKPIFSAWCVAATDALVCVHHALFVRYFEELPDVDRSPLENVLEAVLSKSSSIRQKIGLPVSTED